MWFLFECLIKRSRLLITIAIAGNNISHVLIFDQKLMHRKMRKLPFVPYGFRLAELRSSSFKLVYFGSSIKTLGQNREHTERCARFDLLPTDSYKPSSSLIPVDVYSFLKF